MRLRKGGAEEFEGHGLAGLPVFRFEDLSDASRPDLVEDDVVAEAEPAACRRKIAEAWKRVNFCSFDELFRQAFDIDAGAVVGKAADERGDLGGEENPRFGQRANEFVDGDWHGPDTGRASVAWPVQFKALACRMNASANQYIPPGRGRKPENGRGVADCFLPGRAWDRGRVMG